MVKMRNESKFQLKNLKGSDHPEDLGVGMRTMLELITGIQDGKVWAGYMWLL
jgi:hypothetical protein